MNKSSKWLLLALLALAQFMVVLDVSVVNVALPAIKQALHFSTGALQWIITAYALTFGGFLLLGGRAADLFGRRRVLSIGMAGFALFSLLIGFSQSATMLIALRALQGMSAALMSPSALSIVLATFREGKDRNTALGVWSSVAAGGAATGLLLGGVLTQYANWRWNFFINVPIGLAVLVAIQKIVPVHGKQVDHNDLDLPGAVLVTGGLMSLVYGLAQASVWGWTSLSTIGVGALAAAFLGGFVWNESRATHPLVPLSIFRIRNVTGANMMMAPMYAMTLGTFFLVSVYLQSVLHFSPVLSGLSFLPFPIVLVNVATRVPKLIGKWGYRPFLIAGPLFMGTAMLLLTRVSAHSNYFSALLPALMLLPFGMGMTMVSLTIAATSGVPTKEAGLASGLIGTSQQMGGALGLGVLSSIAASAVHAPGVAGVVAGDRRAFASGILFAVVSVVIALLVIRSPRKNADKLAGHTLAHAAAEASL